MELSRQLRSFDVQSWRYFCAMPKRKASLAASFISVGGCNSRSARDLGDQGCPMAPASQDS
jgi:hypothetical protein